MSDKADSRQPEPATYELAGFGDRAFPRIVDDLITIGVWWVVGMMSLPLAGALSVIFADPNSNSLADGLNAYFQAVFVVMILALIPGICYEIGCTTRRGYTTGKGPTLRVILWDDYLNPAGTAKHPDLFFSFTRWAVLHFLFPLVVVSILLDKNGRGWHDKAAGTVVVKVPQPAVVKPQQPGAPVDNPDRWDAKIGAATASFLSKPSRCRHLAHETSTTGRRKTTSCGIQNTTTNMDVTVQQLERSNCGTALADCHEPANQTTKQHRDTHTGGTAPRQTGTETVRNHTQPGPNAASQQTEAHAGMWRRRILHLLVYAAVVGGCLLVAKAVYGGAATGPESDPERQPNFNGDDCRTEDFSGPVFCELESVGDLKWDTGNIAARSVYDYLKGPGYMCLIDTADTLWCWEWDIGTEPRLAQTPQNGAYRSIEAGDGFLCGITIDQGTVACWTVGVDQPEYQQEYHQLNLPDIIGIHIDSYTDPASFNVAQWGTAPTLTFPAFTETSNRNSRGTPHDADATS